MKSLSINEEAAFCALLCLQGVIFLIVARGYPAQAQLFPTVVLVPQVIALAYLTVKAVLRPAAPADAGSGSGGEIASALFWIGTLLVLVFATGMVVSMAILPILFMRFYAHEKWGVTLAVAAIISFSMLVFFRSQAIPIYPGIIWEALRL